MAGIIRILLKTLLPAAALTGCHVVPSSFLTLSGNYRYDQGLYHEAVANYFKALEYNQQISRIYYNLGTAYNALGETEPALEMWNLAKESPNTETKTRALYNQGVVYYQLGRYDKAIEAFRSVLLLDSNDINAKVNLELAIQKNQEGQEKLPQENSKENTPRLNDQQKRTLDYLKRRETYLWGVNGGGAEWQKNENDW
jgi:Ca-activated chloride channel family protein